MMAMRVAVVGGGIIGLATAFRLQQRIPGARVTILEKERAIALHQSSHNSGVLHCGLYYKPGSKRARLAVRGIRQMIEFCQKKIDALVKEKPGSHYPHFIDYEITCWNRVIAFLHGLTGV